MASKEALKNFIKTLCEYETDTNNKESVYPCWYRIILEDLERLDKLEKENELLKLDNQDLHNQIKKNVKEHYKEFMEDYDCLLEEYHELYKVWEKLKKVIEILKEYRLKVEYIPNFDKTPHISFNPETDGCCTLSKEEYELLKEVLNNGR